VNPAGRAGAGLVTLAAPSALHRILATKLTEVRLVVKQKKGQWSSRAVRHHILRTAPKSFARVCHFRGNYRSDPGKKYGSYGFDRVTVRAVPGASPAFLVTRQGAGGFSRKSPHGCVPASPVRQRPVTIRFEIPPSGTCKRTVRPRKRP